MSISLIYQSCWFLRLGPQATHVLIVSFACKFQWNAVRFIVFYNHYHHRNIKNRVYIWIVSCWITMNHRIFDYSNNGLALNSHFLTPCGGAESYSDFLVWQIWTFLWRHNYPVRRAYKPKSEKMLWFISFLRLLRRKQNIYSGQRY